MCVPTDSPCMIGGCEWYYDLQLLDADENPVDLFGSTAALTLRPVKFPDGAGILDGYPVDLRFNPDSQGNIPFYLTKTTSGLMTPIEGDYTYEGDVIVTYSDGTCEVILNVNLTARKVKD